MARFEAPMVGAFEGGAAGGAADTLFTLGMMHSTGREIAPDLVTAHKWFNLAAMRGNAEAKRYRMEIALEMTKVEIAEAQRQAREWLRCH